MAKKDIIPTRLLWMDLEMTGLDASADVILEVAVKVTDFDFTVLEEYETLVKQDKTVVEQRLQLNPWWQEFPAVRDAILSKLDQGESLQTAQQRLMQLVTKHFPNELAVLAGNSIYIDRQFVKQYWPELDAKLHYRLLDVSSFKIVMQAKYNVILEKPGIHRAQDDIAASIAELKHYLDWFKNNGHGSQNG